ncbi:hypothetical protein, partial [Olsenella sp. Marseille-P4559]|uniref:hypothetical protein n=1 Tax=Olsenella sp. Marseille-P4559 TaxID=2364795 RepID=UPI001A91E026
AAPRHGDPRQAQAPGVVRGAGASPIERREPVVGAALGGVQNVGPSELSQLAIARTGKLSANV